MGIAVDTAKRRMVGLIIEEGISLIILDFCVICSLGSYTSGFDVKQMDPEIYKSLIDCGWRRCGTYFYRPEMTKSCCKSYTIRMDAKAFEIKKS